MLAARKPLLCLSAMLALLAAGHRAPARRMRPHGVTIALGEPLPYHAPRRPRPARPPHGQHEEHLVALTIWGEARGRGDVGMRAIANVIMNRSRADPDTFGTGTTGVVWHRRQFSCWNPSDPNRKAMRRIAGLPHDSADYRRWIAAKDIAHSALAGRLRDRTGGATFYHAGAARPGWNRRMRLTRIAWGHSFYKPAPARA